MESTLSLLYSYTHESGFITSRINELYKTSFSRGAVLTKLNKMGLHQATRNNKCPLNIEQIRALENIYRRAKSIDEVRRKFLYYTGNITLTESAIRGIARNFGFSNTIHKNLFIKNCWCENIIEHAIILYKSGFSYLEIATILNKEYDMHFDERAVMRRLTLEKRRINDREFQGIKYYRGRSYNFVSIPKLYVSEKVWEKLREIEPSKIEACHNDFYIRQDKFALIMMGANINYGDRVIHIDGDTYNDNKDNLRICSKSVFAKMVMGAGKGYSYLAKYPVSLNDANLAIMEVDELKEKLNV